MSFNKTKPDEETSAILQLPEMKGVWLVQSPWDKYWWINKIYKYGQAFQRISYGQLNKVIIIVKELYTGERGDLPHHRFMTLLFIVLLKVNFRLLPSQPSHRVHPCSLIME
jgi:hypothetical protein